MPVQLRLARPPVGNGGRIWVGYSGGVDSTVLLHLLAAQWVDGLHALHVHHGLQPAADDWVRHCRRVCRQLGVPLRVLRVDVAADGEGLEAAARQARYAAVARLLRPGDVFATAHHRDDQAETVLFRALRGTGIAGLGAMRECEPLGAGLLWRPLLDTPRQILLDYAQRQALPWIDDPHNHDFRFARVFLRTAVLPLLADRFPAASAHLARLARHARAAETLLAELGQADLQALGGYGGLDIAGLQRLSVERRHNALYQAWRMLGRMPPDESWYARLQREVLDARADAHPVLASGGVEARRYRGRLYLMPALPPPPDPALRLRWPRGRSCLALPDGCGVLHCRSGRAAGCVVRFGLRGERLRPVGARHRRTLKNLSQEAGLPPWVRERMPLIETAHGELLAAGTWLDARAAALGLAFDWQHDLPGGPN
ncbi:tRNA(Ile)-lysidine synthase [Fontimonas thermophila]|uniref:tRNA(Ile)-lysidine synthase n=1 Tax=Fontimonas thermophila TaxID=1076937 RepID=A0A1I2HIP2_9GAMM|nr:tRNA lysidine(34) synthetase TilS [Fontimonas thermophila]SFF30155.1 tRNA(Ile)-lysidine synthase [Fontimonas thermophila]